MEEQEEEEEEEEKEEKEKTTYLPVSSERMVFAWLPTSFRAEDAFPRVSERDSHLNHWLIVWRVAETRETRQALVFFLLLLARLGEPEF